MMILTTLIRPLLPYLHLTMKVRLLGGVNKHVLVHEHECKKEQTTLKWYIYSPYYTKNTKIYVICVKV